MAKRRKPIRDKVTGKEYRSKVAAGKDLAKLIGADPGYRYVFYKVHRAFPERFEVREETGEWVPHPYTDYFDEAWKRRQAEAADVAEPPATRVTTVEIDSRKVQAVQDVLGTRTLRDTVDRSLDEVLARAARERSIEQLQTMRGLDLDKPDVMARAWR